MVANSVHREIVEGLLAAGKHVLTGPAIVTRETVAQIEEYARRGTR